MERTANNVGTQTTWGGRAPRTGTNHPEGNNNNGGGNVQENPQEPSMFQLMQTLVRVVHQQQQQQNVVMQLRDTRGIIEFKKLSPPSFEGSTDSLEAFRRYKIIQRKKNECSVLRAKW